MRVLLVIVMVDIVNLGKTSGGSGDLLDKLLPVAVIGVFGYLMYSLLAGRSGSGSDSLGTLGGGSPYAGNTNSANPGSNVGTGNSAAVPQSRSQFVVPAGGLVNDPANLGGGGSWTRYAIPAALPAWAPPGLVGMVSGRDSPQAGQVAIYNPATGNAWTGREDTMQYLYTAGSGLACDMAALAACRTAECTNAITAACWRANYG